MRRTADSSLAQLLSLSNILIDILERKYWARWTADLDHEDIYHAFTWLEQLPEFKQQFQEKHPELSNRWLDSHFLGSRSLPIQATHLELTVDEQ